jgi:hypothetical protein
MNPDKTIQTSDSLILTTLARAKNTGMRYSEDHSELTEVGESPLLLEPVNLTLSINGKEAKEIIILDHLGYATPKTIETEKNVLSFDGKETHAIYYLLKY